MYLLLLIKLILRILVIFLNYLFKDYYIVFLLLKKNERGLRGKQRFGFAKSCLYICSEQ